jgi:hypothetical protein
MKKEHLVCLLALTAATTLADVGCAVRAGAYAQVGAPVTFVAEPTLVAVDADVWVVRDYDYAVYYVSDNYWVLRDGVWYRSASYDEGWTKVEVTVVPAVIVHRDHKLFVHYRGEANAKTRPGPKAGKKKGPPDHAAAHKGGPPGQDETPGLGDEKRADDKGKGKAKGKDKD